MSNDIDQKMTDVNSQSTLSTPKSEEYHTLRNRLLRAHFLVTEISIFDDEYEHILSPEEITEVGKLPPEAPSILDIINEDRGEY